MLSNASQCCGEAIGNVVHYEEVQNIEGELKIDKKYYMIYQYYTEWKQILSVVYT